MLARDDSGETMFKQNEDSGGAIKNAETIIGESIKVKGNFHGEGNIIIEGVVDGSVKTNNFLLVGTKAKIAASIEAKNAKVAGEVSGNVEVSEYLEIKASAKITGDVAANQISIEKGAMINGNITMGKKVAATPENKQ